MSLGMVDEPENVECASIRDTSHDKTINRDPIDPVFVFLILRMIKTGSWLGLVPASVMRFGSKGMRLTVLPVKVPSAQHLNIGMASSRR